jgi:protein gp37
MAERSKIEWTDHTFNPWMGCTKVGPGCDHCYAEARLDTRLRRVQWGPGQPRQHTAVDYWRQPLRWNETPFFECAGCGWRGSARDYAKMAERAGELFIACCPDKKHLPARQRVFCASLADVFDNEVDPGWRRDLFALIEKTPNLDWLLLTKRVGNAERMMREACGFIEPNPGAYTPRPNVWLGVTVVNQEEADRDIPKLLATPARVRFLSMEPLLGPVDLHPPQVRDGTYLGGLWAVDWVIVGGESGTSARPMHPDWARSLRDQCAAAGVPFLFKQWGAWAVVPYTPERRGWNPTDPRQHLFQDGPEDEHTHMERVGKERAGRLLDGRTYSEYPVPQ